MKAILHDDITGLLEGRKMQLPASRQAEEDDLEVQIMLRWRSVNIDDPTT